MTYLTIFEIKEIRCSFRLVLKRETDKGVSKSSRLEFLENLLGNNFALSNTEDNNSRHLNNGCVVDLPLLRTILAIYQTSCEPRF